MESEKRPRCDPPRRLARRKRTRVVFGFGFIIGNESGCRNPHGMTRLEMIRAAAGGAHGQPYTAPGQHAALHGTTRKRRHGRWTPHRDHCGGVGWFEAEMEGPAHRRKKWVGQPDPEPVERERQRHTSHPLTVIAAKWSSRHKGG